MREHDPAEGWWAENWPRLAEDKAAAQTHGEAELARHFTGSALATERRNLANAVAAEEAPDFQALDGGADSLIITSQTQPSSDTVQIVGSYRAWSKMA